LSTAQRELDRFFQEIFIAQNQPLIQCASKTQSYLSLKKPKATKKIFNMPNFDVYGPQT
jgi:hypothetical protein